MKQIWRDPALLLATWFGAGLSPKAPGTVGSLAALPFIYAVHTLWENLGVLTFAVVIFFIGWWASKKFLARFPDKQDPGMIVIDEVAGQALALCVLFPTWQSYLAGFLVFRLFDVVKPWPVSLADQRIKGGLGVMCDDVLAGLYPVLILLAFMVIAYSLDAQHLLTPVFTFLGGKYVS